MPGRCPSPSVAMPHRSASPALCPFGHAASVRRRASSFVGRPVCKPPERGVRVPVCKAARGGHRQAFVVGRPVCKPRAERGARVRRSCAARVHVEQCSSPMGHHGSVVCAGVTGRCCGRAALLCLGLRETCLTQKRPFWVTCLTALSVFCLAHFCGSCGFSAVLSLNLC